MSQPPASTKRIDALIEKVKSQKPFSTLPRGEVDNLFSNSKLVQFPMGATILKPDQLSNRIYLIITGNVRLLGAKSLNNESFTLDKRGPGQLIGWSSLLRGDSCEWVTVSEESICLTIEPSYFIKLLKKFDGFKKYFSEMSSLHEVYSVLKQAGELISMLPPNWEELVTSIASKTLIQSVDQGATVEQKLNANIRWFISTSNVPRFPIGKEVNAGDVLPISPSFNLSYRLIGVPSSLKFNFPNQDISFSTEIEISPRFERADLTDLGIIDPDLETNKHDFPLMRGNTPIDISVAICEMIASFNNVPFRREAVQKISEYQYRRGKDFSLQFYGGVLETLGLSCQIGNVNKSYLCDIEVPFIFLDDKDTVIVYKSTQDLVYFVNPKAGFYEKDFSEFISSVNEENIIFLLPSKSSSTPQVNFGFSWFFPLLNKYRKSLVLVFIASLLAQLFGLAIPLIIQQIVDKVLAQGNLSSLNILGGLMIIMALFQGILTALRTYIFVDTTDRIDLSLGSSVINRLLSLPLSFFEKRPVGELSQRLGELNTIRNFLTGTALNAVLSIIFAFMYLVVMLIYSPLLTAVALSTLPVYIIMIFIVAPIYKGLIRNKAVAQARTQSHLIEILGGIQTVKAQHFERTARWKWQDRYSNFINEGFKSVALGVTTNQIGSFLNTLSSLLVLWVGMWLVLQGELTLGMLIAFRIISGNVTSPLLQLSGLYQGYQGVQLSVERLSDIVDQNPEFSSKTDTNQISLPPVYGKINFEDVSFRFNKNGPFQVNNVNLNVPAGSFVGVVGQSGSGKSTLMKLLPRLYEPESGRILIDGYDIGKVNLTSLRSQIGIVPQDSLLFEGTISENIGINDSTATSELIIEAAKISCAHEFIMTLPQGYATPLSERGGNLSGGQRQRIAIARTILANPNVLILDEATSALDYNTEKELCNNLQSWAKSKTVLFITHRLATIKNSDLIVMMNDGYLVESGTHDALIAKGERYFALYNQQDM